MAHTFREKVYTPELVEADIGVPPDRIVDLLALIGDSIDNIPGVPGIGEKGAPQLIREFGSLEALLDRTAEVKRKNYREGLEQNREQALLSKELATIRTDLPLTFDPRFARAPAARQRDAAHALRRAGVLLVARRADHGDRGDRAESS